MTALSHEQVSARLKQLPSLPSAVSELLASFSNEEVDVEQIARLIGRDQGLTARVLRVANSSFYGLQCKVGTINEAVVVLGFRAVRSMVMAVGMNGAFSRRSLPGLRHPGLFSPRRRCWPGGPHPGTAGGAESGTGLYRRLAA